MPDKTVSTALRERPDFSRYQPGGYANPLPPKPDWYVDNPWSDQARADMQRREQARQMFIGSNPRPQDPGASGGTSDPWARARYFDELQEWYRQAERAGVIPSGAMPRHIREAIAEQEAARAGDQNGQQMGRFPHQGFGGQHEGVGGPALGTRLIRPGVYEVMPDRRPQGPSADMINQRRWAQQQARKDEKYKRQFQDQLMQVLQMLMSGGGNQVTPPSMGGFNSGQYNMRPPAGEIL